MKVTVFVADKLMNNMMKAFDLCPDYKVFASPQEMDMERKGTDSDTDFAQRIINMSKKEDRYWIPVVVLNGYMYVDEGIREVSNGHKVMFVR